jgi:hypothetical protein
MPFVLDFLRDTRLPNIYRYLVTTLVAGRDEATLTALTALAASEPDAGKRELLRSALALRAPEGKSR